ncbi:hypothetical protein CR513_33542, partial [Mucuna pruriens]
MYQRLVTVGNRLAHTRPNIAYLVSVINHFIHNPCRILHYLKGSPKKEILFKRNNILALEAYALNMQDPWFIKNQPLGPIKFYCDNKSTINIAYNLVSHDKTKHIEIDRHFIKEKLEEGMNDSTFHDLIIKLGMEDIYSST